MGKHFYSGWLNEVHQAWLSGMSLTHSCFDFVGAHSTELVILIYNFEMY